MRNRQVRAGLLAIATCSFLFATACGVWKPIETSPLAREEAEGASKVRIRLFDGREVQLRDVRIDDDTIRGTYTYYSEYDPGPRKPAAFALEEVRSIEREWRDGGSTALVIGVAIGAAALLYGLSTTDLVYK